MPPGPGPDGKCHQVKLCLNEPLHGRCEFFNSPTNYCVHLNDNMLFGGIFNNKVTSLDIQPFSYCEFFDVEDCAGGRGDMADRENWPSGRGSVALWGPLKLRSYGGFEE